MTLNEYKHFAMRTNSTFHSKECLFNVVTRGVFFEDSDTGIFPGDLLNAALGLSGEVGELNDHIKKALFHGHDFSAEYMAKEIGDILWYIALMCEACGFSLEHIAQLNVDKLKARYPEGFTEYASQHRESEASGE